MKRPGGNRLVEPNRMRKKEGFFRAAPFILRCRSGPLANSRIGTRRLGRWPGAEPSARVRTRSTTLKKGRQKAPVLIGGERGIRTLGTLARTTVFETAPFDRS